VSRHPSLPGLLVDAVADEPAAWPVESSERVYASGYLDVDVDVIVGPDGARHSRAVVRPNGAVGVLALDDADRLLLVVQYRHPVGERLVELPAGTLDVEGEKPLDAAARELAEEADVVAATWSPLISLLSSGGYTSEECRIYRATDLTPVPEGERTERRAEEAEMEQWWVPFGTVVDAVLEGRVRDAMMCAAVLAEHARRHR
jgi:ADP-ribose pyrophosphatase